MVASLVAGLVGNSFAVLALWLRLRWKAFQRADYCRHIADLAVSLPRGSSVVSRHDAGGLHTQLMVGVEGGQGRNGRG